MTTTKMSHIDLNVSDYRKSVLFYDMVLLGLGWTKTVCRTTYTNYSDGTMKICICPTEEKFLEAGFHRKRTGLNHLAFYATSKEDVDRFHKEVLIKNNVPCLYENGPYGDDDYYAVFFEDPDRMKLEVVYAPRYCDPSDWTNQFESDFDPYTDDTRPSAVIA